MAKRCRGIGNDNQPGQGWGEAQSTALVSRSMLSLSIGAKWKKGAAG